MLPQQWRVLERLLITLWSWIIYSWAWIPKPMLILVLDVRHWSRGLAFAFFASFCFAFACIFSFFVSARHSSRKLSFDIDIHFPKLSDRVLQNERISRSTREGPLDSYRQFVLLSCSRGLSSLSLEPEHPVMPLFCVRMYPLCSPKTNSCSPHAEKTNWQRKILDMNKWHNSMYYASLQPSISSLETTFASCRGCVSLALPPRSFRKGCKTASNYF